MALVTLLFGPCKPSALVYRNTKSENMGLPVVEYKFREILVK